MEKMGYNWAIRKIAGFMGMTLIVKSAEGGIFTSMQTKLLNSDVVQSFTESVHTKGD